MSQYFKKYAKRLPERGNRIILIERRNGELKLSVNNYEVNRVVDIN